ncbi:MAG: hypothetical protein ACJ8AO_15150 [Gemmatimonadaceae bacterium]
MIALLLLAQVVTAGSDSARAREISRVRPDSARGAAAATARDPLVPSYATETLRALVARAAQWNRVVPASLQSYRARLESETALIVRRAGGGEVAAQLEQTVSRARWLRTGDYEQRVVGYRSQQVSLNISTLSFWQQAWTVPVLYGNRIALLFGRDTTARRDPARARRAFAVHPLAEDRDRLYRFSGGDTVITLQFQGRTIPIVRVHVEPRDSLRERWVAFQGELDLDAQRGHLVRMRGSFVRVGGNESWRRGSRLATLVAYVEFVNKEIEGEYWLPAYQRIEAQAAVPLLGDERSVMRVVTRFVDYQLNDTTVTTVAADSLGRAADTLLARPHRLVVSSPTALDRFDDWGPSLGAITEGTHSDDFADLGPDVWRTAGAPTLGLRTERTAEFAHFSRVEGVYTGLGLALRFRDALPNARAYANAGWAWSERTLRGRVGFERRLGRTTWGVRAGRTLDVTNDFASPMDSGPSIFSLLSAYDDYDYVDRYAAAYTIARSYGATRRSSLLRAELAAVSDQYRPRAVETALVGGDSLRENRGVLEGEYARLVLAAQYHPEVTGEFLQTGQGAMLRYEGGAGDLDYHRAEVRLTARRNWRRVTLASRLDAGIVVPGPGGVIPPQQLFELGEGQNLPGYDYKEFGGDRAAVLRGLAMYNLPFLRAPIRAGSIYLPSIAPAIYTSLQSGWADAGTDAARRALRALGTVPGDDPLPGAEPVPVSVPTDGIRASVEAGLRFFGGAVGVGVARPVDRAGKWRVRWTFAQEL